MYSMRPKPEMVIGLAAQGGVGDVKAEGLLTLERDLRVGDVFFSFAMGHRMHT